MKKWMIPVLALTVTGSVWITPPAAHAWPWSKKDNAEAEAPAVDAGENSAEKAPDTSEKREKKRSAEKSAKSQDAPPATDKASATGGAQQAEEGGVLIPRVQVQSPLTDELNSLKVEDPVESQELPPDKTYVTVDDPKNPLGVTVSAQKLNACAQLISQKKYKEAQTQLTALKDWLVEATEAHINLYKTLKNFPNAQVQAELEKQLALQFALLRDKSFFQLGMLAIGQQDYPNAVKNLSHVIQSQPRSPMGAQAYEVLQKIGFTEKIQLREEKKTDGKKDGTGTQHVSQTAP